MGKVLNGYFLRKFKKMKKHPKENTALSKILATYCLYHQQQLILILKFIKEEQEACSQVRCGHLHISEQEESSKRQKISPAVFYSCTKKKLSNCVSLKKQASPLNLPYLSVRLKDLRLTWPNLALGTVKLNPIKHEDLHLKSNDQILHCINTRSKKKKLFIHCSSRYRAISCSSNLPRLKLQRITCLNEAMVKNDSRCQQACPVSIKHKSCQTEVTRKTVMTKSSNSKDLSCDINKNQNNVMPTENNATTQSSQEKCQIGSVHFGNLIKHLLNNSQTNHFVELLNQDTTSNSENTGIQTRLRKSQQKSPIFDCSLSNSQSLEFTSKLNFCDAFPKEKNTYGKDLGNSSDMAEAAGSKNGNDCDIVVMQNLENSPENVDQEKKTKLPHSKSKIHSKNVNCVKNSHPCLPESSAISVTQNVNTHNKRRSHQDSFDECNIPFKRYSRNILGKCKFCDVSHGQCSFPSNSNLFCKCTIKHNSGILKNFKTNGLVARNTTDKARHSHLKIVVERLENTICSDTQIPNSKENCETKKTVANQGKSLKLPSDPLSINSLTSVISANCLISKSSTQNNQIGSSLSSKSVIPNSASGRISENTYFSPIKLMFVSKIESEDGVKYALSPVYKPFHNNKDHQPLAALRKHSSEAQRINAVSDCSGQSGNPNNSVNPQCKVITSSASEAHVTIMNPQEESKRIGHHTLRKTENSAVRSESKDLDKEMPVKMKNDLKICIPYKTTKSVAHSKMAVHLRRLRITDTYVAKNISSTQIKIKRLHKNLESPVTPHFTNILLPEEHTMPVERDNCKISQRLSTRLQKLGNPSTVSDLCVVNECSSEQEKTQNKTKSLSDVQTECSKKADNLENGQAEQNHKQKKKTKPKKYKLRKSRLIRKQTLSNYMTRSKKSPLFALYYGSQSKFSVRCALLHKSKQQSIGKNKNYRQKLRSYKQQCKPPSIHLNGVDDDDQTQSTSTDSDLQTSPDLDWWSTTTSNETLLNHLERRYEHIAKTWVNVENNCETQSSPVCKFSSSDSMSPIQMLFQKKCDNKDLATWFMQTTETQSLSIVRKANARKPRHKATEKGSGRKTKQLGINCSTSKTYLKKCSQMTQSRTLEELHHLHPESLSLTINKHNLKMNRTQHSHDQTKDVCVKFSCPEVLDLTEFCTSNLIHDAKSTVQNNVQSTKHNLKDSTGLGSIHVSSTPSLRVSRAQISSKQRKKALKENEPKCSTRCQNNKLNIKDCRVFLTKCGSIETKILHSNEMSNDGNSRRSVKSSLGLNTSFRTKYKLQMGNTFAKRHCLKKIHKSRYQMCLRNMRQAVAKCGSHCNTSAMEERSKHMRVALYLERNNSSKEWRPSTGKAQTEYTKLQIGPLKPVGFPATRSLISKFGSYSLTPIRIPLK